MPSYFLIACFLLVSLFVANALAWLVEFWQQQRIDRKSNKLSNCSSKESQRLKDVPVTLLTGFLGAGKTTLLNRILGSSDINKKFLVIVNEFGQISIDHALLKVRQKLTLNNDVAETSSIEQDGIYVMKNGCICCSQDTPGNELERVLDKLILFMDNQNFDHVIIETTGLAIPEPILRTFERMRIQGSRFYVQSVITVVDAKNVQLGLDIEKNNHFSKLYQNDSSIWIQKRQVVFADFLILNKIDSQTSANVNKIKNHVMQINPLITFIECNYCDLSLKRLFSTNNGMHNMSAAFERAAEFESKDCINTSPKSHMEALKKDFIESFTITTPHGAVISSRGLHLWFETVLQKIGTKLLRTKGIINVDSGVLSPKLAKNRMFVVNGVGQDISASFGYDWKIENNKRKSSIVFIGRDISCAENELKSTFQQLCMTKKIQNLDSRKMLKCDDGCCHGHSNDSNDIENVEQLKKRKLE